MKGFAIHCHHNILVEYCYDYDERVEAIKRDKPENEQKTRLRLFKILPEEALKDIPVRFQKAYAEREKAGTEWKKANAEWSQSDKDTLHKKWCNCSQWNGQEIMFKR